MAHTNLNELIWAERVREIYIRQRGEGVEEPVLSRWPPYSGSELGGNRFELLGEFGLRLSTPEPSGPTFIEPIGDTREPQNG
jgi:hypothetical protein